MRERVESAKGEEREIRREIEEERGVGCRKMDMVRAVAGNFEVVRQAFI